jgi:hypothetical protein
VQISIDGFVAEPNGEEDWVVRASDGKLGTSSITAEPYRQVI